MGQSLKYLHIIHNPKTEEQLPNEKLPEKPPNEKLPEQLPDEKLPEQLPNEKKVEELPEKVPEKLPHPPNDIEMGQSLKYLHIIHNPKKTNNTPNNIFKSKSGELSKNILENK
jgi:hypothetical protein